MEGREHTRFKVNKSFFIIFTARNARISRWTASDNPQPMNENLLAFLHKLSRPTLSHVVATLSIIFKQSTTEEKDERKKMVKFVNTWKLERKRERTCMLLRESSDPRARITATSRALYLPHTAPSASII